ncbi:hypothetical protein KL920_004008 [Ogataea angusta]|nr:hypothetical protein KL920_004008 [Ogataea angusta]
MICEKSVNMSILGPVLGFPNRVPVAIETDWLSRAQLFGPHAFRTDGIDNKTVPLQAFFGQPEASPLGLLGLTLHKQRLSGMSIQSVNFTAQSIPVSNRLAGLTSRAGKIDHVSERVNAMLRVEAMADKPPRILAYTQGFASGAKYFATFSSQKPTEASTEMHAHLQGKAVTHVWAKV